MAHYRSVGYGYDINYVARFRSRARREFGVDDFFTIFLQVLPNYEHGWWSMPAQFNTKGHQDMRYPILVLLTTLVVTSLGATGQGEMESVVAFNIVTSGVNEVFRSLIMLMMIPCFLLLCMVQREWVVWLSAFVWVMGVFAMPFEFDGISDWKRDCSALSCFSPDYH